MRVDSNGGHSQLMSGPENTNSNFLQKTLSARRPQPPTFLPKWPSFQFLSSLTPLFATKIFLSGPGSLPALRRVAMLGVEVPPGDDGLEELGWWLAVE